ncbi:MULTISPECIES: substrate-binding domain-containing protein [Nostocales]|uniref:PBP domain-containing protein n=3 Tax=Nostocales TaxID=1161 RepID=A0A0C1R9F9_9CYAN|nr:substrate-binding domain-containing protein [Tolypothrix bouteillei]KAF3885386.1 hypothetical protein DA73_0400007880 [Tolypothrix bouteillei VB521301]
MNPSKLNNQKTNECSHCGYDKNPIEAKRCRKCGKPLNVVSIGENSKAVTQPKPKPVQDLLLTPWIVRSVFGLLFLFLSWLIYSLFITVSNVSNSDRLVGSGSSSNNADISPDLKLYNSIKDVPNVPEGTFNYGGGATFAALTARGLNDAIARAHPNFRLRYTLPREGKPGGRKGITMLLDSQLSLTLQGASLRDADYDMAKQRGFQLKQVPIALDMFVFFTHRDISIPGLSVNQLQDIYTGKITNWSQVGGPNLSIVPFSRDPKNSTLLSEFLGSKAEQVSSRVQFIIDYTDAIRKVASTPGGISFGGVGPIVGQQTIRPLAVARANTQEYIQPFIEDNKRINTNAVRDSTYPLTRRLFIVFRQDGTIDELAGYAFIQMLLSKEGQQIVEKAELVPIR